MRFLLSLIVIGIVLTGRAAYVALKIKKDPETTKYGNNPKRAIGIMGITGAVLFAVGCIGLPVLEAIKPTVYTFENNSSFVITIFPEFGNDLQIQSGAIKSFESSHKNMNLSYSPHDYVAAQKTKSSTWEFTNYNFYYDESRKFLIYPPEGWEIANWPGMKYKIIVGQVDNDFAPNINFSDIDLSSRQFSSLINATSRTLQESSEIISRGRVNTNNGLEGYYFETNTERLLQVYYIFDLKLSAFTVTCSAPLQSETDYNEIFDSTIQTLEFLF
jgi:hypothetical protein